MAAGRPRPALIITQWAWVRSARTMASSYPVGPTAGLCYAPAQAVPVAVAVPAAVAVAVPTAVAATAGYGVPAAAAYPAAPCAYAQPQLLPPAAQPASAPATATASTAAAAGGMVWAAARPVTTSTWLGAGAALPASVPWATFVPSPPAAQPIGLVAASALAMPMGAAPSAGVAPTPLLPGSRQGRRRALLIGCNYAGTSAALRGCINDVHRIRDDLRRRGFLAAGAAELIELTDDSTDPALLPTRFNVLKGVQWLVAGAQAGDALFFLFSGHGGQQRDPTGVEADGVSVWLAFG